MKTTNKLQTILTSDCRNKKNNVMIDGQNFFDQPVGNHLITHESIKKIATDRGDDYRTIIISKTNIR